MWLFHRSGRFGVSKEVNLYLWLSRTPRTRRYSNLIETMHFFKLSTIQKIIMVVSWQYLQVKIFSIHLNHGQNKPQAICFLNMIFTRSSEIFEWNGIVDAKPGGAVNPTAPAKRKWPGKAVSTGGLPGQNRKERAKGWSFFTRMPLGTGYLPKYT